MNKAQVFWMVVGGGPTSCRHKTFEKARNEARRLARHNVGTRFYVTRAVVAYEVPLSDPTEIEVVDEFLDEIGEAQ